MWPTAYVEQPPAGEYGRIAGEYGRIGDGSNKPHPAH
jgi:hypothetical protein